MPETINLNPIVNAISTVNNNLEIVARQIDVVGARVEGVAREQADTRQRIEQLYEEFQEYVEKDEWANELSTARQELTLTRQELETRFSHYAEVRRHTTGILQAVDVAIVREETVRTAAEELMLACPGYWLAPSLVGLSAWICDNQSLAEKALAEAVRRDDSKSSLFFSLVCRRAKRMEACSRWLVRYFQIQNPDAMDREAVVMLDALANGVFGGAALTACSAVIDSWLGELEEKAGFPEEQRRRWAEALGVMTLKPGDDEYPTLRKYSPTWPALEASLAAARRNQVIQSFFEQMFSGEIILPPNLETAVDELLDSLVTNFDDEELPLRRKERFNEIIIETDRLPGRARDKKSEAERRYQAEADSLNEQTNFAALLTNAAMYPERHGATRATQRYAVSRSRQWIIAGFNDLVARDRAQVPAKAVIVCGSWTGESRDGLDEQHLVDDLNQHYAVRIEEAVNAVSIPGSAWAALLIGGLLGFFILLMGGGAILVGLLIMAAASAYFYFQYSNLDNVRQQTRENLGREQDEAARILKAALAELTDIRRETASEDKKADGVIELLSALSSPQFVLKRSDQARMIMS
ncbi:MAG: hypothetical protein KF868_10505 [Acidobacteria bacterium]|nr:hypothetical protein [Acidobacteriota bacterium]